MYLPSYVTIFVNFWALPLIRVVFSYFSPLIPIPKKPFVVNRLESSAIRIDARVKTQDVSGPWTSNEIDHSLA